MIIKWYMSLMMINLKKLSYSMKSRSNKSKKKHSLLVRLKKERNILWISYHTKGQNDLMIVHLNSFPLVYPPIFFKNKVKISNNKRTFNCPNKQGSLKKINVPWIFLKMVEPKHWKALRSITTSYRTFLLLSWTKRYLVWQDSHQVSY